MQVTTEVYAAIRGVVRGDDNHRLSGGGRPHKFLLFFRTLPTVIDFEWLGRSASPTILQYGSHGLRPPMCMSKAPALTPFVAKTDPVPCYKAGPVLQSLSCLTQRVVSCRMRKHYYCTASGCSRSRCLAHSTDTLGLSPMFRILVTANTMDIISTAHAASIWMWWNWQALVGRVMFDVTNGTSCSAGSRVASPLPADGYNCSLWLVARWTVVGYSLRAG